MTVIWATYLNRPMYIYFVDGSQNVTCELDSGIPDGITVKHDVIPFRELDTLIPLMCTRIPPDVLHVILIIMTTVSVSLGILNTCCSIFRNRERMIKTALTTGLIRIPRDDATPTDQPPVWPTEWTNE
jgi:hypothetical protein